MHACVCLEGEGIKEGGDRIQDKERGWSFLKPYLNSHIMVAVSLFILFCLFLNIHFFLSTQLIMWITLTLSNFIRVLVDVRVGLRVIYIGTRNLVVL